MFRRISILLILAAVPLLPVLPAWAADCECDGRRDSAAPDAGEASAASKALHAIFDDYEKFRLRENPIGIAEEVADEAGSQPLGVTPGDDARRKSHLLEFRQRLREIDESGLSREDRTNAAVFAHVIEERLGELRFDTARFVFNSEGGPEDMLGTIQRGAALRSAADVETYLRKLEAAAGYIRDMTENARRGIETGWTQPRSVTNHLLPQLREHAELSPEADVAYQPLLDLPDTIASDEQGAFRTQARDILATRVRPAQQAFVDMIEREYLPGSRDSLGISEVPEGKAYYRFLVRKFTTTDLGPDEIHELGQRHVRELRARMEEEMEAAGWRGDLSGFIEFLRTDPQFYAKSREELLMRASTIAKEIDGRIPAFFRTPPRLTYNVTAVPREIEDNYTIGRYNLGSLEDGIPGSFVVNTSHLDQRPLYELPDLALHEGVPGHHLQIAIRQEARIPWFRRHFQFHAYTEGWAHYGEWLGLEMGIYKTPYDRFGLLSAYMWRACRLVADTGIHWLGWSLDEARECFIENSALARHNIETELQRYIAWPGQALSYKVGELKMRELRARAEDRLGEQFDIRTFHDMILWGGDLPLDLLEKRTERWITEQLETE